MTTPTEKGVGKGRVLLSTYEWDIDNYSSYSDLKTGEHIKSPTFSANRSSWYLKLYPNGEVKNADQFISLRLTLITDTLVFDKTQALLAFTLLDSNKKVIRSVGLKEMVSYTINENAWGFKNFLEKSVLANNPRINKITIVCELMIQEAKLYKAMLTTTVEKIQHFETLNNQLNEPKFSDVKFTIENKEIHAHKMVLAAHSSVFTAMFEHKMRENEENIVKIEDISYKVFFELLRFVYVGECTLSQDIVSELFEAADKYQLLKLKKMCEEELCKSMSVGNVMAILQLADMHSAERLKKEAIDFIALHGKEIVDKPEFDSVGNLNTKLLKDIFRGVFAGKN